MIRAIVFGFFLMFMAAPVWAAGAEPFNPEAPFQQGLTTGLLRSLLNQAFDQLEDHLGPENGFILLFPSHQTHLR